MPSNPAQRVQVDRGSSALSSHLSTPIVAICGSTAIAMRLIDRHIFRRHRQVPPNCAMRAAVASTFASLASAARYILAEAGLLDGRLRHHALAAHQAFPQDLSAGEAGAGPHFHP